MLYVESELVLKFYNLEARLGLEVMLNSTEYEFIMLIIVKMPSIVKSGPEVIKLFMLNSTDNFGLLTFMSMINTTLKSLKARKSVYL